jgi:hypothetical protein
MDGGDGLAAQDECGLATAMVQGAIDKHITEHPGSAVAVLVDGPYGVPRRTRGDAE